MGTASTPALSVKKRIESPGLPCEIWEVNQIVSPCGRGLRGREGRFGYSYFDIEGRRPNQGEADLGRRPILQPDYEEPLPVKNYKAKPDRSVIYLQADFDANDASDDDNKGKIVTIFGDGVKGIKKQALATYDAIEAAAGKVPAPDKGGE
jgi:hypothetical protein